ncbi:MAG: hypothetical protein QME68_03755 [Elusimicrobiota bacterium]|nr:hypothetical protein [Elusimicrobiota bacterium]
MILSKEGNISALGILIERYQQALFNFWESNGIFQIKPFLPRVANLPRPSQK